MPVVTVDTENPKKKPVKGRKRQLAKEIRLKSHVTGPPCNCKALRCFEITNEEQRAKLIFHLNSLKTKDEQDGFLASLISVHQVKRRRSRKEDLDEASYHKHSFKYHLNVISDGKHARLDVCVKGFVSIFGVTENRVRTIRESLANTGLPPKDMRGHHNNRPHAFSKSDVDLIVQHIQSFQGCSSHYTLNKTKRMYLPKDLNISKMYGMFMDKHPNQRCSYERYRTIFNTNFNISFGYPRKGT